ncbi:MAG: hypothetical protein ACRD9R_05220 [Pyrinomonadaceae bacterium]
MQRAPSLAVQRLSLTPLGAGDLIDRTIRLYRRHFLTLIRTAAPPMLLSAAGSVLWTVGWREVWVTESGGRLTLYVLMMCVGWLLMVGGYGLYFVVMGGASRNLVAHLLWNEAVLARTVYRHVRARFWGLVGALFIVGLYSFLAMLVTFFISAIVSLLVMFGIVSILGGTGWVEAIIIIAAQVGLIILFLTIFFWLIGRVAYVPQAMLVEGLGVMSAVGRSFTLARGNVRRLLAMFLFTTFATYAALMLLLVPLGWYGYTQGVDPNPFVNTGEWPLWYAIGNQVVGQVSSILLAPVWMLGLSLLYVDERVRHEGYDIELLAAQRLGAELPQLPAGYVAPLAPALAATASVITRRDARPPLEHGTSVLGLSNRPHA